MLTKQRCMILWAGALVKWLWDQSHDQKVVGSNPSTLYWMDSFNLF